MLNNIRDWTSCVVGLVSLYLTLKGRSPRRRRCRRERFRSFKGFGIEWTSFDRDDRQS
ncbi:hypothetical protein [Methylocapsa acidiphila]|uniref:hypothetical protein n=1 Tax=Methylocapsa acidiphila TaxID=133552 RepID=UPI0003FA724A|nr:hypothetical protein [Methylocapsa acidiphila]